jgi:hypothetical protein
MKKAYPCIHYLDDSAASQLIGVERWRDLLGSRDESRLAAMDGFVAQLVASAGVDGPECGRWQGEIRATAAQRDKGTNPNGDPFTLGIDPTISCQIGTSHNTEPPCETSSARCAPCRPPSRAATLRRPSTGGWARSRSTARR